jgi:methionyl-tRNA formyltransferase
MDKRASVVILATECDATRAVYDALIRRVPIDRVIFEDRVSRRQLLKGRARKLGVAKAVSQAAFSAVVVPALRAAGHRRLTELRSRIRGDAIIPREIVERVPSVNSPECIALLERLAPAVIVVSGTRILGTKVLSATGAVFINMHAGITPRYRGTHGAYWAQAEGRPGSAGVTVHLVDRGIDTGGILAQATIQPTAADTFVTLPYLQLEAGIPLLVEATIAAREGTLTTVPSLDDTASKLWFHPTLQEYFTHWIRQGLL